jgi:hypothetical protein
MTRFWPGRDFLQEDAGELLPPRLSRLLQIIRDNLDR